MHVLFLDNTDTVEASVKKLGEHLIQISGAEVNLSGFHLLNDAGNVFGKYDGFKTLYKENEDSYILSNDGSVYVEPVEPEPMPVPEPTLDEVKEAKVAEMNKAQQDAIQSGVDVTLSDGSVEHFSLTDHDQTSLVGGAQPLRPSGAGYARSARGRGRTRLPHRRAGRCFVQIDRRPDRGGDPALE